MRKQFSLKTKIYGISLLFLCTVAATVNYRYYQATHINDDRGDYVKVFTDIYARNEWAHGSGLGSDPENAKQYMVLLQNTINDPRFKTIVDVGCGDWQLMRHIRIQEGKTYTGFDVVENIVVTNTLNFAHDNVHFEHTSSLQDLLKRQISGDLLIIKDVMQHWPVEEIQFFISNILPRFKYALITNNYVPTERNHNKYKLMGPLHSVGLLEDPFKLSNTTVLLDYDGPDHKQVLLYENPNLV